MKAKLIFIVFLLILVSTSSCFFDGVKGNGNVVTKIRHISDDFIRINASAGINVFITQNGKTSLLVEADENLHELIVTEVKNGTLYINIKKKIWHSKAKNIHLTIEEINEIEVSGGSRVTSENTLNTDDLKIIATNGAKVNLSVHVNNLNCESSRGADINLEGTAKFFNVNSSSGSDIDAFGLNVINCVAKASGGSDIKVNVEKSFEAKATSGADIRFKGNPEVVTTKNSFAGKVKKS